MLELPSTQDFQDILSSLLGEVPLGPWVELRLDPLSDSLNGVTQILVRVYFTRQEKWTERGRFTQPGKVVQNRLNVPVAALVKLDTLKKDQTKDLLDESIKRALMEMQGHIWLHDPRIGTSYGNLPKCPWFDSNKPPFVWKCPLCQKLYVDPHKEDLVWASAPVGWVHRECLL